ncbi:hypothetical protein NBRC116188_11680 [Oceaniserpentilla sp. 4NH20-0058]|uniref:class I SAM-dependent methyltransferase n=1 Tax=Oceaniserpentilla sp. 4NH20-0058 TaxID=3127660 RepID=UPI0031035E83
MPELSQDYLAFLKVELPKLKTKRLPFWRKSRKTKHDTLRYVVNKYSFSQAGLCAEFGVFKGVTIRMMANKLPSQKFYGFDSFTGFPDDGRTDWQHDFSLQGKLPDVPKNVTLIQGYFEDTLEAFVAEHKDECFALMHIDCDIYSSTKTIFNICKPMIKPGCIIVFDELLHYSGFENHEMLAFYEFLSETGLNFEWLSIRNKVLDIEEYLTSTWSQKLVGSPMKVWREMGYEQEVAIRII